MEATSKTEEESNKKRWEESGQQGSVDQWRWTLNWDSITDTIIVGSCPRSPEDVDTLVKEAQVEAIICLQSDGCFEALNIDYPAIVDRGTALGLLMTRVAIWDFNHDDQALMLPEAVRMLGVLQAMGKRTYVHCTAGINRATLTVVGYLTFVQGWERDKAVAHVKRKRSQAHPYMDCWKTVRSRLTEGRTDQIIGIASKIYQSRQESSDSDESSDDFADWVHAESILIRECYQRQIQASLTLVRAMKDLEDRDQADNEICMPKDDFMGMQAEMGMLATKLDRERAQLRDAEARLKLQAEQVRVLRESRPEVAALIENQSLSQERIKAAEQEILSLKDAIREVAMSSLRAVSGSKSSAEEIAVEADLKDTAEDIATRVVETVAEAATEDVAGQAQNAPSESAPEADKDGFEAQQPEPVSGVTVQSKEAAGSPAVDIGSPGPADK